MTLIILDNLIKTNQLKLEPFEQTEFIGLIKSGKVRFKDAHNITLEKDIIENKDPHHNPDPYDEMPKFRSLYKLLKES